MNIRRIIIETYDKKRNLIIIELLLDGEPLRSWACDAAGDLYFATLQAAKDFK